MTPTEILHYAIGELAYAMAASDGEVQKEERQQLHDIVHEEVKKGNYAFDFSRIMFQIVDKEERPVAAAYSRAMRIIRLNNTHFTPEMKAIFASVLNKVAEAFPPVTPEECSMIANFENEAATFVTGK